MTAMARSSAVMVKLNFLTTEGTLEVEGSTGMSLMEAARLTGVPGIVAECGGAAVCATCHVHILPEWLEVAGQPSEAEAEILEFALGADATSRLSCQIRLIAEMEGLSVRVPETQG